MRILVYRHVLSEHLGLFEDPLRSLGCDITYCDTPNEDALDPVAFDALIVMGGPMNVAEEDRYPFLIPEKKMIRRALELGKPYLGVCLGAQLLADALGADVYAMDGREIGFYELFLTEAACADPLFCGLEQKITVFQWHGQTFNVPEGAELIVTGDDLAVNQGFRAGNAWGLQFHPEVNGTMIGQWATEHLAENPDAIVQEYWQSWVSQCESILKQRQELCATLSERFVSVMSGKG